VGDQEGVIVIPNKIIEEISEEVKSMTVYEDYVIDKVQNGSSIKGLYPLTDEKQKNLFESWINSKSDSK
jgi:regulator of RNase E activity RraA